VGLKCFITPFPLSSPAANARLSHQAGSNQPAPRHFNARSQHSAVLKRRSASTACHSHAYCPRAMSCHCYVSHAVTTGRLLKLPRSQQRITGKGKVVIKGSNKYPSRTEVRFLDSSPKLCIRKEREGI